MSLKYQKERMNQQALLQYGRKSFNLMHSLFYILLLLLRWGAFVGHHVITSPAPHTGLAVVAALNILEGFNITSQLLRNTTYHRIAEVVQMQ